MNLATNTAVRHAELSQSDLIGRGLLSCPNCESPLEQTAASLTCGLCGQDWPIVEGVPHFGGTDPRHHQLTLGQRELIAQIAATKGWQVALHDVLRRIDPTVYRQAADEYRAQWRYVAPLSANSRVLDLSSGWGAIAFSLAETCELVVAADACPAQTQLVALRARQSGQDNLLSLQLGLDQGLPFANGCFDAVVLLDAFSKITDTKLQRLILRRIHNVLRPNGSLFLADLNRLSVVLLAKRQALGNPHTLGGYRRLLHSVGFRGFRAYSPIPSHLEPFFMVPLDRRPPLTYFLRNILRTQDFRVHVRERGFESRYALTRMMVRWIPATLAPPFAKLFAPSIAILAHK